MMPKVRILTPWRVLIAIAAITCAATPSKAGMMTLTIANTTLLTSNSVNVSTDLLGLGTSGPGWQSISLGAYTLQYIVTSSYDPSSPATQTVSLQAKLSSTGSTSGFEKIEITLKGSGIYQPAGSVAYLQSNLSDVSFGGAGLTYGTQVSTQGRVDLTGGDIYLTEGNPAVTYEGGPTSGFATGYSDLKQITNLSVPYILSGITTEINLKRGTAVNFTANATVALPEPGTVVSAIVGLPFVAGVVGMFRRRIKKGSSDVALSA